MMSTTPYNPQPANTAHIPLPSGLDGLLEQLAARLHDVWARQRLDQGWALGPARNDDLKTHPCLVPYAELSEMEKEYDRQAAAQTIKSILSLGYTISPAKGGTTEGPARENP